MLLQKETAFKIIPYHQEEANAYLLLFFIVSV